MLQPKRRVPFRRAAYVGARIKMRPVACQYPYGRGNIFPQRFLRRVRLDRSIETER